jgi:hypothetical protein
MFGKKASPVTCAVCGKGIEPSERRFIFKNRITKTERHLHPACHNAEKAPRK